MCSRTSTPNASETFRRRTEPPWGWGEHERHPAAQWPAVRVATSGWRGPVSGSSVGVVGRGRRSGSSVGVVGRCPARCPARFWHASGTTCTQGLLRPIWDPDQADSPAAGPHFTLDPLSSAGQRHGLDGAPIGHKSPPVHRWPRGRATGRRPREVGRGIGRGGRGRLATGGGAGSGRGRWRGRWPRDRGMGRWPPLPRQLPTGPWVAQR